MTRTVDSTGTLDALTGGREAVPSLATMMIKMITPSQERGERV